MIRPHDISCKISFFNTNRALIIDMLHETNQIITYQAIWRTKMSKQSEISKSIYNI